MINKKQSSVEWLYSKMYEHRGNITIEEFEQAKAMHKDEIVETARYYFHERGKLNLPKYYKETFEQ